jgi:hypothetical protein
VEHFPLAEAPVVTAVTAVTLFPAGFLLARIHLGTKRQSYSIWVSPSPLLLLYKPV